MNMQPESAFEDFLRQQKIVYIPEEFNRILDVGCGSGKVWPINHRRKICGIEPDAKLRQEAIQTDKYYQVHDNLDKVNVADFDCVTIMGVLEHIEDDLGFLNQFKEAKAIYITVPNADSFHRFVGLKMGIIKKRNELGPQDFSIGHKRIYDGFGLSYLINQLVDHSITWMGSYGFKWSSSTEVEPYQARFKQIHEAAVMSGFVGFQKYFGAELFALLERI